MDLNDAYFIGVEAYHSKKDVSSLTHLTFIEFLRAMSGFMATQDVNSNLSGYISTLLGCNLEHKHLYVNTDPLNLTTDGMDTPTTT